MKNLKLYGSYHHLFADCLFLCVFLPGLVLGLYIGFSTSFFEIFSVNDAFVIKCSFIFRILYFSFCYLALLFSQKSKFINAVIRIFTFFRACIIGFIFFVTFINFGLKSAITTVSADFLTIILFCKLYDLNSRSDESKFFASLSILLDLFAFIFIFTLLFYLEFKL